MPDAQPNRRPRGTGRIFQKHGSWYGSWRVRNRHFTRKLGAVRKGKRDGLTQTMAEERLREVMGETQRTTPTTAAGITVEEAGVRRIRELARKGRRIDTTLANYESEIRTHFKPYFTDTPLSKINSDDVEDFLDVCFDAGLAAKTVRNLYSHLSSIFTFAVRKHWCSSNPCAEVEKPASADAEATGELQFLDEAELEAVLSDQGACRHTRSTLDRGARARALRANSKTWKQVGDELGVSPATAMYLSRAKPDELLDAELVPMERALYLTAALTGLRQGELLALRWRDVDWLAAKIRVVHSHARRKNAPEYDELFPAAERRKRKPKSAAGSRSVPMADRVGAELDRHFKVSSFQGDDHRVFCHPVTGDPLNRHEVTRRFRAALKRTGVREVRFHDLRHTFGTMCAAAGVPMRTLQEWMGHASITTTQIYAHYAPSENEAEMVNRAFPRFGGGRQTDAKLGTTQPNSPPPNTSKHGVSR